MDGRGRAQPEQAIAKTLKAVRIEQAQVPPVPGAPGKPHKKRNGGTLIMTNEELNTALYQKMFAEQETYRKWLLGSPGGKS